MIPNIVRGTDAGGAVAYLVDCESQKNQNVHVKPHVVAGTVGREFTGVLTKADARVIGADINAFQKLYQTDVAAGHVWHCSLSLKANELAPGDAKWGLISTDFMDRMGFDGQTRWVAIDHGASPEGNPHIHIVASVVKADGSRVNTYKDMPKSQKVCTALEQKYGLQVLQSRVAVGGAGSVAYTQTEIRRMTQEGKAEPDRVTLERKVRTAAAASSTEQQFVQRLKTAGVQFRPFPQSGPTTGYSVALNRSKNFLGGGKLARDLTLPQLRRSWQNPTATSGANALKLEPEPLTVQQVLDGLKELGEQIQTASPEEFADLSHDLAATLAATSEATEDSPGELAGASREVGAWAQPQELSKTHRYSPGANAIVVLCRALDKTGSVQRAVMVAEIAQAVIALHRLHRASRPVVGPERSMAMSLSNNVVAGATAVSRFTTEWAEQRALARGQSIDYRERVAANPVNDKPDYWTADDIRASRLVDKAMRAAEKTRAQLDAQAPRATDLQRAEMAKAAADAGINLDPEQFDRLRADEVDQLTRQFKAVPDATVAPLNPVLPDPTIHVPTGLKEVRTPEDADAFIQHLERLQGAKLDAQAVEARSNVTNLPPAPASTKPSEMVGAKDPRNWDTATDGPTGKQVFTLRQLGLSNDQIGTLNKGEASFVIGSESAGGAFEENLRTSPFKQPEIRTVVPSAPDALPAQATSQQHLPKPTLTQ